MIYVFTLAKENNDEILLKNQDADVSKITFHQTI